VRLYQVVVRLPDLVATLSQYKDSHEKLLRDTFTAPLQQCAEDLEKFTEMVETTIDLEAVSNHQFLIKAEFDEALQASKVQMEAIEKQISQILMKVGRDLSLEPTKKLKLETSSQYGHYLKIARNVFIHLHIFPILWDLCVDLGFCVFDRTLQKSEMIPSTSSSQPQREAFTSLRQSSSL